ncbi:conserved serine proline-rich protein [Paecilomyces variotii No. 5]|uniref:Conserved serine proline-rich protein n=1 Tax=Byssochlamys spectabilis (strain No. 5 / NBRC 109023) TaxID=1356009 RepID=V5G332_BYSSN|nr:conserved serine proline-rich protein [Paecilomyces variotii No. 5]
MVSKVPKLPISAINGHTAGIYADMSVDGPSIGTLVAVVDRAKNLPNRKTMGKQNPYCAARLGKEAKKTETDMRGGQTPRWDQELRFTVHESPDYYQLKVSVFNDDKRTDLIGETWIDLKNLVIPGGGQSDQWHQLQFKGKYAGEVRIEMTYYDTRPEDEAVIERRKGVEKVAPKSAVPAPVPAGTSLSGPREPKPLKRRPLPIDPTGAPAARPATADQPHSASSYAHPPPTRPVMHEHAHTAPPVTSEYARPTSRHAAVPEPLFAAPPQGSSSVPRTPRGYHTSEDLQREYVQVNGRHGKSRSQKYHYEPRQMYQERPVEVHYQQAPPEVAYEVVPQSDRRQQPVEDRYYRTADGEVIYSRGYETEPPRHAPVTAEQPRYHTEPSYGQRSIVVANPSTATVVYDAPPPEFTYARTVPGAVEPRRHSETAAVPAKIDVYRETQLRKAASREEYHPEYASMQPRVEDEDEDGPPPPPPVHKSSFSQTSQAQDLPAVPYQAYSPDPMRSASPSTDFDMATSAMSMSSRTSYSQHPQGRLQDIPANGPDVPPSLVAGYDPVIAEAESARAIYEKRAHRNHDEMHLPEKTVAQVPEQPLYQTPTGIHRSNAVPTAEPGSSYADTRVGKPRSVSPNTRGVPPRKSVSPRPPPVEERGLSGVPFSPDSYDALNPNAGRSKVRSAVVAFEGPEGGRDAISAGNDHDMEPIIGDDGKVIDPSDHLPSDTWAPEPERKTKKPEVVVRFKHTPQSSAATRSSRDTVATRPYSRPQVIEVGGSPSSTERASRNRLQKHRPVTYATASPTNNPVVRTSPRGDHVLRERENYSGYGHARNYSSPSAYDSSPNYRVSTSPTPASKLYETRSGPPIPAKVPVAQPMNQNYPVMGASPSMDALSREIKSIDIGTVGCGSGRTARSSETSTSVWTQVT